MLNLLFPRVCNGCNSMLLDMEEILCAECRHGLPLAYRTNKNNESLKHIFYGRYHVQNAISLFRFQKKGITQRIMHNLKYRGQKNISDFFGKWLGAELIEDNNFTDIDIVIPVPLHKQKLRKRGYNQVDGFAKEIAKALQCEYRNDILIKISKTNSQVFKKRLTRYRNKQVFTVKHHDQLRDKHVLLVDDIVTTGATLENCALEILHGKNTKLSIATMAVA